MPKVKKPSLCAHKTTAIAYCLIVTNQQNTNARLAELSSNQRRTKEMKCNCKDSPGWTTTKCCNLCGLPINGEVWKIPRIQELEARVKQLEDGVKALIKQYRKNTANNYRRGYEAAITSSGAVEDLRNLLNQEESK